MNYIISAFILFSIVPAHSKADTRTVCDATVDTPSGDEKIPGFFVTSKKTKGSREEYAVWLGGQKENLVAPSIYSDSAGKILQLDLWCKTALMYLEKGGKPLSETPRSENDPEGYVHVCPGTTNDGAVIPQKIFWLTGCHLTSDK